MVLESFSNQTFIVNVCVYKDVHPIKRLFWTLSDVFPETVSVIHKMFDLFSYKSKHSAGCVPQSHESGLCDLEHQIRRQEPNGPSDVRQTAAEPNPH